MFKTSYKDIYCTTQRIYPIFYNNYKWGITFKIVNHYIVPCNLYNIVHQLYFEFLKEKENKIQFLKQ